MALTDIAKTIGKGSVKAVVAVAKGTWWITKNIGNEAIKSGTGIDLIEESEKAKMRARRQLANELKNDSELSQKEIDDRQKALYIKEMYENFNSLEKSVKEHKENKLKDFVSDMEDGQLLRRAEQSNMNEMARKVINDEIEKRRL